MLFFNSFFIFGGVCFKLMDYYRMRTRHLSGRVRQDNIFCRLDKEEFILKTMKSSVNVEENKKEEG